MVSRRKLLCALALLAACERGPQGPDDGAVAESLADALTGRVGLIVGVAHADETGAAEDGVLFEGFFARHRGLEAMAVIDALDARPVADVLGHRPGECWRETRRASGAGEIHLLEADGLSAQGAASVSLEGKAVPALLDRISGTLYRTGRAVSLGADRLVRIRSTGGRAVGAFEVQLKVPGALHLAAPQVLPAGRALELEWSTDGALGDAVVISVQQDGRAVRCVAADQGSFKVAGDLLGDVSGATIVVKATRVRLSSFSASGLQSAHAAILVEDELRLSRGE